MFGVYVLVIMMAGNGSAIDTNLKFASEKSCVEAAKKIENSNSRISTACVEVK